MTDAPRDPATSASDISAYAEELRKLPYAALAGRFRRYERDLEELRESLQATREAVATLRDALARKG